MEHIRNLDQLKADLAADPNNAAAIRGLVRLEVIPAMERDLAAAHSKRRPDPHRIAALTAEIQVLHSNRDVPDHIRAQLVGQEPVVEPTP